MDFYYNVKAWLIIGPGVNGFFVTNNLTHEGHLHNYEQFCSFCSEQIIVQNWIRASEGLWEDYTAMSSGSKRRKAVNGKIESKKTKARINRGQRHSVINCSPTIS